MQESLTAFCSQKFSWFKGLNMWCRALNRNPSGPLTGPAELSRGSRWTDYNNSIEFVSSWAGLQLLYVPTCKGLRVAAVRHLKNAWGPAGLGPRVRGRKWCHAVLCCPALFLWQPLLYWRPPRRLGTNGPRTALFISQPHWTPCSSASQNVWAGSGHIQGSRGRLRAGWTARCLCLPTCSHNGRMFMSLVAVWVHVSLFAAHRYTTNITKQSSLGRLSGPWVSGEKFGNPWLIDLTYSPCCCCCWIHMCSSGLNWGCTIFIPPYLCQISQL